MTAEEQAHGLLLASLNRAAKDVERRMDNFVRPLKLTFSRIIALLNLAITDHPLTPSELGERLVVTRGNMTGIIDGLVKDGLVQRVPRKDDRRTHDLELTSRGAKFIEGYLPYHLQAIAGLNAGLTLAEAAQLTELLGKLRNGMRSPEALKPRQLPPVRRAKSLPERDE